MRPRPVRSKIYLPVVRFGVVSTDWKFVVAATLLGYLIPFFFDLKIWKVPLWLLTGLASLAASVLFFNYIRTGRKAHWFQHTVRALVTHPCERAVIPSDRAGRPRRPWLIARG